MLEEILKKININLERVANALEKDIQPKTTRKKNKKEEEENTDIQVEEINVQIPVEQNANMVQTTITQPVITQPVVPVNVTPETYTQEEIARAMSSAMDIGRNDVVFGILNTFNTNSLMGIKQEQYGEVARMLREAGIKI